ncbi:hypothetical protein [Chondromyces apiculatus]|uniref:Disintegrin domain-containing protein n=1 Tax=Chondromyces apiculatus DSM 436 TaxID=1192034 RepID=A0A017SWH6_9BACT|nr:hypothetical protein [Chondromyces apiculatus]EYF00960.1 Hypothetical protein CAP_8828 [Chondromyces apiculatus DSM 436]
MAGRAARGVWWAGCLLAAACMSGSGADTLGESLSRDSSGAPAALRAAYIASIQADAPEAFHFRAAPSGLAAEAEGRGLTASLGGEGARVVARGREGARGWEASFGAVALGCEGAAVEVGEATPVLAGRRAEYRQGEVVTWYQHGPLGLEQGFDLARRPGCAARGEGAVEVSVAVGGSVRPVRLDATAVRLVDEAGEEAGRYAELFVRDAEGREVPAKLDVQGERIRILVDDREAVYPLVIDPLVWEVSQVLTSSGGSGAQQLGASLAISGDTAVIGAPRATVAAVGEAGAAYVFTRTGGAWVEQQKLTASYLPGSPVAARFGASVAISGDTVVIGAPAPMPVGSPGRAYVFTRSGSTWTQQQQLTPADGQANDEFGNAVAVDADTLLVGAHFDDDQATNGGSVYIFGETGGIWSQVEKLIAIDGGAGDAFGESLSFSGDLALVGAPGHVNPGNPTILAGAVYVMARVSGAWEQAQKLDAPGPTVRRFGYSVARDGTTAAVGAPGDTAAGLAAGAVYVLTQSGGIWTQAQQLLPDTGTSEAFGTSVALRADRLVVGAPLEGATDAGAVHFFDRSGGTFLRTGRLPSTAGNDKLGISVGVGADTVIAGAPGALALQGVARVFHQVEKLDAGQPCGGAAACLSGFCVDGVCCNQACGGGTEACRACSEAAGAAADGVCTIRAAGEVCRPGAGACDAEEVCDGVVGTCPGDALAPAGTSCRASVGGCDAEETCDGATVDCPEDALLPSGATCRASVGGCDAEETCDGLTDACPPDGIAAAGVECRAATGACDVAEVCDGTSGACPDDVVAGAGVECRAATGGCDMAEVCDGLSGVCPDDALAAAGTVCRDAESLCDAAEVCDGANAACPDDVIAAAGVACRPAAGPCDFPESCNGVTADCPADVVRGAGVLCRAALGTCDVAEVCDGVGAACPTDMLAAEGTACPGGACVAGVCTQDGTGGGAGGEGGGGVGGAGGGSVPPILGGDACSCRLPGDPAGASAGVLGERAAFSALALMALAVRRRGRRGSR